MDRRVYGREFIASVAAPGVPAPLLCSDLDGSACLWAGFMVSVARAGARPR
jgi:hypothetical protein